MIITDDKDKIIEAYKKEQVEYTNKFIDMQKVIEYLEKEKDRLGSLFYERNEENIKLHHIIKEVREYIDNDFNRFDCFGSMAVSMEMNYKREELLEILDKVGEE